MEQSKKRLRYYFIILHIICGGVILAVYNGHLFPKIRTIQTLSARNGEGVHLFDKSHDLNFTKILFWTSYYGDYNFAALTIDQETFRNCPVKCQLTFDKRLLSQSDAVIFHVRDLDPDNPTNVIPDYHPQSQVWVFLLQESPKYTYIDLKSYGNVFNWTMTHRRDSDVYHPYGRFVRIEPKNGKSRRKIDNGNNKLGRELSGNNSWVNDDLILYNDSDNELFSENQMYDKSHPPRKSEKKSSESSFSSNEWSEFAQRVVKRPKLVAWVASHCDTKSDRESFVTDLQSYLHVDIYGKCGTLNCLGNSSLDCYPYLGKQYKFYLSFENSLCTDYVTEKFYDILRFDVVPVVFGGANYSQIAPFKSFINTRDFATPKELAIYLLHLDSHPEEYLEYFTWKKFYRVESAVGFCSLCMKLNNFSTPSGNYLKTTKWYSDIHNWWYYIPKTYPQVSKFSTSSVKLAFEDSFPTPSISSSLQDNQYDSQSLKASRLGLSDSGPQESTCLTAPVYQSELEGF